VKKTTDQLLAKAVDAIEAAELLVDAGKNMIAAGRTYYAMFYAAEALLFESGQEAKYLVIGGMAMIQAGFVRATVDVDIAKAEKRQNDG